MAFNTIIFDNEIKIWWQYVRLLKDENFAVSINGQLFFTTKSHYNFNDLKPETEYNLKVEIIDRVGNIVKEIGATSVKTKRKKKRLDITKPPYNAVGNGVTLDTNAIQQAINDCAQDYLVYIPRGTYLSGALNLKSNVEIYLEDGAILLGSTEPSDYLPKVKSRFDGWEMYCYRSLLNAGAMDNSKGCNTENIVIRGGKILGGGNELRKNIIKKERHRVLEEYGMINEISPHALYSSIIPGRARGRTICCSNTKNLIVANTVIGNAPAWNLHFIYCENITICGCSVISKNILNGDGINPDSTVNCTIFDIEFDTGDDCVSVKSGKNPEGFFIARPSKNIYIFDCLIKTGHGISIGSEMSGGVSNVHIWNIQIELGLGIFIKTRAKRGGYVKDVTISNCNVPVIQIGEYGCVDDGESAPEIATVSNINVNDVILNGIRVFITNLNRREAVSAVSVKGLGDGNPVNNLSLKNITLKYRSSTPYHIIGLDNVKNLSIENITCEGGFNP